MMKGAKDILSIVSEKVRKTTSHWWGGIGCKVAFFMSLAIFLVSALISGFFLWEGKNARDAEVRSRALHLGSYFSSLVVDDIITENGFGIYQKLMPAFLPQGDSTHDSGLQYLLTA